MLTTMSFTKSPLHWKIGVLLTLLVEAAIVAYVAIEIPREHLDLTASSVTFAVLLVLAASVTLVLGNAAIVYIVYCAIIKFLLHHDGYSQEVVRLNVVTCDSYTAKTCLSSSFRHRVQAEYEVNGYSVFKTWERKEQEGMFAQARAGALRARALTRFPCVARPILPDEDDDEMQRAPWYQSFRIPCLMTLLCVAGSMTLSYYLIVWGLYMLGTQADKACCPNLGPVLAISWVVLLLLEFAVAFPRIFLYDGVVEKVGERHGRDGQGGHKHSSEATTARLEPQSSARSLFAMSIQSSARSLNSCEEKEADDQV